MRPAVRGKCQVPSVRQDDNVWTGGRAALPTTSCTPHPRSISVPVHTSQDPKLSPGFPDPRVCRLRRLTGGDLHPEPRHQQTARRPLPRPVVRNYTRVAVVVILHLQPRSVAAMSLGCRSRTTSSVSCRTPPAWTAHHSLKPSYPNAGPPGSERFTETATDGVGRLPAGHNHIRTCRA